jgi:hypothetical protein
LRSFIQMSQAVHMTHRLVNLQLSPRRYRKVMNFRCLRDCGFEKIEIIEREPYPGVEYES